MDVEEKLLQALINYAGDDYDKSQDPFLLNLIEDAIDEVCSVMYPCGYKDAEFKQKARDKALLNYESKIRRIAEYHYDKQGKEGVTSYSENGSSASYENSGTPDSYFRGIIPISAIL